MLTVLAARGIHILDLRGYVDDGGGYALFLGAWYWLHLGFILLALQSQKPIVYQCAMISCFVMSE